MIKPQKEAHWNDGNIDSSIDFTKMIQRWSWVGKIYIDIRNKELKKKIGEIFQAAPSVT